jgi:hypothetical protein
MKRIMIIGFVLLIALSSLALASKNPAAKVAVHVRAHNAKAGCNVTITGCADITATYPGFSVDAFPVFFDLVEYLGVEYGMCWPGWTYSVSFTSCSDLVIGSIVWPGDGASHTWTACKTEAVALPGWIWAYADGPGQINVCPHPASGTVEVLDCEEGLDPPISYYAAGVFGEDGDDPCEPTATEPTTWSAIKSMFE